MRFATIEDLREEAKRRLPRFLFEYIDGGASNELTLRRNRGDLDRIALRQRVLLRDVSQVDLSTTLFGQALSMPLALGPIGLAGLAARRGEVQAAKAAELAGVPFCLSTVSLCPLAEVANAVSRPMWFQLYMIRNRPLMRELLQEAQRCKCAVLVFTVDMPVPGMRYRDYRSGLTGAPGFVGAARRVFQALQRPKWSVDVGVRGRPHCLGNMTSVLGSNTGLDDYFAWIRANFDPTVTWSDLDWVRAHWTGPIVLKGILDSGDAQAAASIGVDGIVVSNHGGRQLDGVLSSAQALPRIVDAVGDRLTVLVDGGVRSGLDVVRMLALGAKAVLLGRAWVYALASRGGQGLVQALECVAAEMRVAMSLTGVASIRQINRESVDTWVNG